MLYLGTMKRVAKTNRLCEEMYLLTPKEAGFHFSAWKTTESNLADFNIPELVTKLKILALHLWNTLNVLFKFSRRQIQRIKISYKHDWAKEKRNEFWENAPLKKDPHNYRQ